MPSTNTTPWSTQPSGHWYRWRGYTVRWLLFGLAISVFQPVADRGDHIWLYKLDQALAGLSFGGVCAVVFTLTQNKLNTPRRNWRSWLIVLATWLCVKVTFVSLVALAG